MKWNFVVLTALALCSVSAAGCKSDSKPQATEQSTQQATAAKGSKGNKLDVTADIPDDAIATEEDFDEEVTAAITTTTDLTGALDALEKEIGE